MVLIMSLLIEHLKGVEEVFGAGVCIPAPLASEHEVANVAATARDRCHNVLVGLALVERYTVDWDDRVVGGV